MKTRIFRAINIAVIALCASWTLAAEPIKIACIGDSITFGVGAKNRQTQSYPAQLQGILGDKYEVINCGTSGTVLMHFVPTSRAYHPDKIKAFQPDIVTIKLGTNDTKARNFHANNKAWFDSTFKAGSLRLLEFLNGLESKPKIYVCLPVPVFEDRYRIKGKSMVEDIIPALKAIAKEKRLPVIDLYKALEGKDELVPDGVHPNEVAYKILAETIATAITTPAAPTHNRNLKEGKLTEADVPREKLTVVEEFSTSSVSLYPDQTYTPVSTFKGVTYLVWVNSERRPMMARIKDGRSTQARLDRNDSYKASHDSHHQFSLGIDNDGYVHVVGDMHNHPQLATGHLQEPYKSSYCMYWVSDKPEDISSFTFVGADRKRAPPGTGYSYYYFVNDRNGVLYLASRHRFTKGKKLKGYGLQRYHTKTKRWEALGGTPRDGDHPVIAWEDNGSGYSFYQAMRGDVKFDSNNRMHFVTTINSDDSWNPENYGTSRSMTNVMYAYSDDGGKTFCKADGTPIASLPMRVEAGPNLADIVTGPDPIHWISMTASVAFTKDNEPFVFYVDLRDHRAKYTQWNTQSGWSAPANLPLNARDGQITIPALGGMLSWNRQWNDGRGVITLTDFSNEKIYRTADLKGQGKEHNIKFGCVDRRYLHDTGELRGLSGSYENVKSLKVVRLKTSLPAPGTGQ